MRAALLIVLASVGCQSTHQLVDPGPAPENGLQIILPPFFAEAGSDNEVCTWTEFIADHDLMVRAVQGIQSETGHHVAVYKTTSHQPPGTRRICKETDLAELRFIAGAGGEGITDKNQAPGNLAFVVEKGYQIVVNEHFLNASPRDHEGQSVLNLYYAEPGSNYIRSGGLAFVDTDLDIAIGEDQHTIECTLERDFKAWYAIPHMHRWGVNIKVDHTPAGGAPKRLFDTAWVPSYIFQPPEMRVDPATPILFQKGDKVHVECNFLNDTDKALRFGPEMCVFFAQTVDDNNQGNWACDKGRWTTF
jgi:hypothetical protein